MKLKDMGIYIVRGSYLRDNIIAICLVFCLSHQWSLIVLFFHVGSFMLNEELDEPFSEPFFGN